MLNFEDKNEIHYFKLVPISSKEVTNLVDNKAEIGFRIDSYSGMNMRKILGYMEENKQLKIQVERLKDSLLHISREYKKALDNPANSSDVESQKAGRRAKKIKALEDENAKLKLLLKSQLDTSEKLRAETFTTVEALKSEFNYLIDELNTADKAKESPIKKKIENLYNDVTGMNP